MVVRLLRLADYRRRHAQYKSDPDSVAMHGRHPLIAVWDDHEIANDAYRSGAQNHQADEGDYAERVRAAVQAYFEWMPIRGTAAGIETRIYRGFDYGELLCLSGCDGYDESGWLGHRPHFTIGTANLSNIQWRGVGSRPRPRPSGRPRAITAAAGLMIPRYWLANALPSCLKA